MAKCRRMSINVVGVKANLSSEGWKIRWMALDIHAPEQLGRDEIVCFVWYSVSRVIFQAESFGEVAVC